MKWLELHNPCDKETYWVPKTKYKTEIPVYVSKCSAKEKLSSELQYVRLDGGKRIKDLAEEIDFYVFEDMKENMFAFKDKRDAFDKANLYLIDYLLKRSNALEAIFKQAAKALDLGEMVDSI
jgi:hypothetical protein